MMLAITPSASDSSHEGISPWIPPSPPLQLAAPNQEPLWCQLVTWQSWGGAGSTPTPSTGRFEQYSTVAIFFLVAAGYLIRIYYHYCYYIFGCIFLDHACRCSVVISRRKRRWSLLIWPPSFHISARISRNRCLSSSFLFPSFFSLSLSFFYSSIPPFSHSSTHTHTHTHIFPLFVYYGANINNNNNNIKATGRKM